ncbi:sigma-70 family RNA polymerase sigma factor [Bacillus sp. NTK034]|uniref:sigma-70 family RNA polymerase sigma factor n=1 Tax=Bacillus sp. NTK034 TaxID=2802176 RepID=UPI001A8E0DCF|nr:sigma-70 family RNA polymerase sigma factor [Bacillus sp. NTK034]MBN8201443.1 sigma-70 family RNA polymerase sigma factor [Bacillus sp. NTK034]
MNHLQEITGDPDIVMTYIMKQYGTELSVLAYSYIRDLEASKDIVQNVFIKCYTHLDTFEGRSSIKTWLYRITINQCKDYLRSHYLKRIFLFGQIKEEVTKQSPETITLQKLDEEQVINHMMTLSKKYREVLVLRFIHSLEVREIAEVLNIPAETVKTRIRRGKNLLKPILKEEFLYE